MSTLLNDGKLLAGLFDSLKDYVSREYIDFEECRKDPKLFTKVLSNLVFQFVKTCSKVDTTYTTIVNDYFSSDMHNPDEKLSVKRRLQPFNDLVSMMAIQLFIIAIFLKIEPEEISDYYRLLLEDRDITGLMVGDPLSTSFNYARHNNIYDDGARMQGFYSYKIISDMEVTQDFKNNLAGRKMSPELLDVIRLDLLSSMSDMCRALELYEDTSNTERLEGDFMISWLYAFKVMDLLAVEPKNLFLNINKLLK